jgi:hypothetical protein
MIGYYCWIKKIVHQVGCKISILYQYARSKIHQIVLNTVGNCNTMVSTIIFKCNGTTVVYEVRRWPKRRYVAQDYLSTKLQSLLPNQASGVFSCKCSICTYNDALNLLELLRPSECAHVPELPENANELSNHSCIAWECDCANICCYPTHMTSDWLSAFRQTYIKTTNSGWNGAVTQLDYIWTYSANIHSMWPEKDTVLQFL